MNQEHITKSETPEREGRSWADMWQFLLHMLAGTLVFAMLWGLLAGMEFLRSHLGLGNYLRFALKGIWFATISINELLFAVFAGRTVWSLVAKDFHWRKGR